MKLGISFLKTIQEAEFRILASRSFHSNVTAGKRKVWKRLIVYSKIFMSYGWVYQSVIKLGG